MLTAEQEDALAKVARTEHSMTLAQLAAETLVAKNRRLRQAKCSHEEVYCSIVTGPSGTFENYVCLDCWKSWTK